MKYLIVGNLGQWSSCILFGVGLGMMLFQKWEIAQTIFTFGAVVFSAFTKVKLIHYEIEESKRRRNR